MDDMSRRQFASLSAGAITAHLAVAPSVHNAGSARPQEQGGDTLQSAVLLDLILETQAPNKRAPWAQVAWSFQSPAPRSSMSASCCRPMTARRS